MKKYMKWGAAALLALGLAGCSNSSSGEKDDQLNVKVSISVSEQDTWGQGVNKWAELAKEESDGKINIKLYPNESLSNGNQPKGLEAVQNGSTEASIHSMIIYNVLDPKFAAPSLPWLIPNYEQADKVMNGEGGEKLKELIRSKGIEPLAFGENGYRQITNSKHAIETPEDLEKLKVRTPSMEAMVDTYKQFGADPTVMNWSEVFTSLQQGVIDGQENPLPIILNNKLSEVQDYLTIWNYMYDPLVFGINKELYDGLDKETQKILKETAEEAAQYQIQLNREKDKEILAELKEQGMKVTELAPEQIADFQEKSAPVIDQYEKVIGKDFLDAFRAE